MKIVLLCGSHPRHLYIANKLFETGLLTGVVMEARYTFRPEPPTGLLEQDRENFIRHFKGREEAENKFFASIDKTLIENKICILNVSKQELNSEKTVAFIRGLEPTYIISYGVHKLEDNILEICPQKALNIHGGLSPWYRGNITLFWPFYFLKPNWAGMTIHHLSNRMDAGNIIHHSVPKLEYGDKIHEVACKAVKQVGEDICKIIELLNKGEEVKSIPQTNTGKLFIETDWKPQHLRLIYNTFDDDIVDKYLNGELMSLEPELIKAF